MRRILCPVDFSETSGKSLKAAKELRDLFSSELHVMHIVTSHIVEEMMKGGEDKERVRHDLLQQARDGLRDLLRDSGIEKAGMIQAGEPYKEILSFSSESDIDFIVMGARGRSRIKGMLTGSVTDAVLRSAPCSVLVVH